LRDRIGELGRGDEQKTEMMAELLHK